MAVAAGYVRQPCGFACGAGAGGVRFGNLGRVGAARGGALEDSGSTHSIVSNPDEQL